MSSVNQRNSRGMSPQERSRRLTTAIIAYNNSFTPSSSDRSQVLNQYLGGLRGWLSDLGYGMIFDWGFTAQLGRRVDARYENGAPSGLSGSALITLGWGDRDVLPDSFGFSLGLGVEAASLSSGGIWDLNGVQGFLEGFRPVSLGASSTLTSEWLGSVELSATVSHRLLESDERGDGRMGGAVVIDLQAVGGSPVFQFGPSLSILVASNEDIALEYAPIMADEILQNSRFYNDEQYSDYRNALASSIAYSMNNGYFDEGSNRFSATLFDIRYAIENQLEDPSLRYEEILDSQGQGTQTYLVSGLDLPNEGFGYPLASEHTNIVYYSDTGLFEVNVYVQHGSNVYQYVFLSSDVGIILETATFEWLGDLDSPAQDWSMLRVKHGSDWVGIDQLNPNRNETAAVQEMRRRFDRAQDNFIGRCFAAGTAISLWDGTSRFIENIEVGDLVHAFDASGNPAPGRVISLFRSNAREFIKLQCGTRVTSEHPFLCKDGRYRPVSEVIEKRLEVVRADGSTSPLSGELVAASPGEMLFNFEVEHNHNYVASGYRVHNASYLDLLPNGALELDRSYDPETGSGLVRYFDRLRGEPVHLYWEDRDGNGDADFGIHRYEDGTFVYQSGEDGAQSLASANWAMISQMAGSFLGQLVHGDGLEGQIQSVMLQTVTMNFARSFAAALGTPVAGNWGEYRLVQFEEDSLLVVHRANAEAWADLGRDISHLSQGVAVGAVSSYLTAELLEAFGVEGFAAELGQSVGSAVLGRVLSNATGIGDGIDGIFNTIGEGRQFGSISDAIRGRAQHVEVVNGGANSTDWNGLLRNQVATFFATRLSHAIVAPKNQIAAVLNSIGTSVGSSLAGPIGAFVFGTIGTLIGNLFGSSKPKIPAADASTVLNLHTGYFELGSVASQHGGDESLVRGMSVAARDATNAIIGSVVDDSKIAGNSNYLPVTQKYGHTGGQLWVEVDGARHEVESADKAVDLGAYLAIKRTRISGGNIFLKRAVFSSVAGGGNMSLTSLSGDLKVANDFARYVRNPELINLAIGEGYNGLSESDRSFYDANHAVITRIMARDAEPLSAEDWDWYTASSLRTDQVDRVIETTRPTQFAAGWLITLQRAAELGLNQTSRSDFYGGLGGLVDSLQIMKGDDLYAEDLRLVFDGTNLEIDAWGPVDVSQWVSDKSDGVMHNEPFPEGWGEVWTADKLTTLGGFKAMVGTAATEPSQNAKSTLIAQWQAANPGHTFLDGGFFLESVTGLDSSAGNDIYLYTGTAGTTIDDLRSETVSLSWVTASGGWGGFELLEGGEIGTFTIEGGDDIFVGGDGNDTLYGRSGYDWLAGGDGNDVIYGGSEDDVILGGGGTDRLYGEGGDDYIAVGAGRDYHSDLDGDGSNEWYGAKGGDGNDTLVADLGNTYLWGDNGDDLFILADGNAAWSRYNGGNGSDTLSFERYSNGVTVDMNVRYGGDPNQIWRTTHADQHFVYMENLTGSEYDDELIGDEAGNVLRGLGGDDILRGGSGYDTLEGGAGADQLFGDGSSDIASYESSTSAVWLDFQEQEFFGGHAEGDTMSSVNRAIGSDFADTFFDRDSWNTRFWGGRGDDWFVVNRGSANSDYFYGDEDFDTVDYADVSSAVTINLTSNAHGGAAAGNKLYDIEQIVGSDFNDHLTLDAKDNYIQGGKGNDILIGGAGLDTYIYNYGDGRDTIYETEDGGGYDTLVLLGMNWADLHIYSTDGGGGRQGAFNIDMADGGQVSLYRNQYHWENVEAGVDALDVGGVGSIDIGRLMAAAAGQNGDDTVIGRNDRSDFIRGYAGNDTLYASGSAGGHETDGNLIWGGRGNDTLWASVGDDEYIFDIGDGFDTIHDSGGDDRIQFGPDVMADDVIYEIVNSDLYIGIRDYNDPDKTASQVDDRIRVVGANTNAGNRIEYLTAGGVDINLNKLDIWGSGSSGGGGTGGGGTGGGGTGTGGGGGGDDPILIDDPDWPPGGLLPPVVFDLDGDGLELIGLDESRVVYQSDSGGPLMRLGWVGSDDGFLALDRDGSGVIDRTDEISFKDDLEGATTDLEGLRAYDSNADGVFDAADERWGDFRIWQDLNQNGIGSGAELRTLEEAGFASINLTLASSGADVANVADSTYTNTAVATLSDGTTLTAYDVALRFGIARSTASRTPDGSLRGTFDPAAAGALGLAYTGEVFSEAAIAELVSSWEMMTAGPDGAGWVDLSLHQDIFDSLEAPSAPSANPDDPVTDTFGVKPIVIDLRGDGLDLINPAQSPIRLDADGDGALDSLGWVSANDSMLALDRDGSGTINGVAEISFVDDLPGANTDLEGLRAYDSNGDGWLSAEDARFADFSVWNDANTDAFGDASEIITLSEAGIEAIALSHIEGTGHLESYLANEVFGEAEIIWADGFAGGNAGDVELRAFRGVLEEQMIDDYERLMAQQRAVNGAFAFNADARRQAMDEYRANPHGEGLEEINTAKGPLPIGASALSNGLVSQGVSSAARPISGPISAAQSSFQFGGALAMDQMALRPVLASNAGRTGLDSSTIANRWWTTGMGAKGGASAATSLAERLARLDREREAVATGGSAHGFAGSTEELAEQQRFLQAIASFRGSSGVATIRNGDQVTQGSNDIFASRRALSRTADDFNQALYG